MQGPILMSLLRNCFPSTMLLKMTTTSKTVFRVLTYKFQKILLSQRRQTVATFGHFLANELINDIVR